MTDPTPGAATFALQKVNELDKRFSTHEAVCAIDKSTLEKRLSRIERILISIAGMMLVGLVGALYRAIGGP